MKTEKLAVLRLLEKGIITADEAERLLKLINDSDKEDRINKADLRADIEARLAVASEALNRLAKKAGDKADIAAKELQPIIKKVAGAVGDKTEEFKNFVDQKVAKSKSAKTDNYDTDASDFYDDDYFDNT